MKPTLTKIAIFIIGFILGIIATECIGQTKHDDSVILIENAVSYEVPMTYELMHIAMALTDTNIVSSGYNVYAEIIDTSTQYYKEVMTYFTPYKNHKLIEKLNKALRKNASRYLYNQVLAYNSVFQDQSIKKDVKFPFFHRLLYTFTSVDRKSLQNFAESSNFKKFYDLHRKYYHSILADVKNNANVSEQQQWLEKQFPLKYDTYNIVISPLMSGTHFTRRFTYKGLITCIMWVAMFDGESKQSSSLNAARYTGVVMTEIDHNYVNPVSDKYKKELNSIMGKNYRSKWTDGSFSNSYKTGYKVFNEYMTHAVYLLFTSEKLSPVEQQTLEKSKIDGMKNRRKFIKFDLFYKQLYELYKNRKSTETITDLYPKMIEWCKKENLQ